MKVIMPAANMDLNNDGKVTIDELARSTLLIAAWLFGGLCSVTILIVLIFNAIPMPGDVLAILVSLAALSMGASFALGVYRMLRYERMEREERLELIRRRKRED